MKKFTITADIRVKNELLEAKVFFDSRIKGLGLKFLKDYRNSLSKLKTNPFYEIRYDAVRCLPLEIFKFMIHFKVDESQNNVLVLAVISTHKDLTQVGFQIFKIQKRTLKIFCKIFFLSTHIIFHFP